MVAMRYDISQTTHYEYANNVALSSQLVRLSLVDRAGLKVVKQRIDVDPTPTTQQAFLDFFGNENLWLSFLEPHGALIIDTHAIVERDAPPPPDPIPSMPSISANTLSGATCFEDVFGCRTSDSTNALTVRPMPRSPLCS